MSTTTPAAELADAMRDAPDLCAQCGTPLNDTEPYLCDNCTAEAYWDDFCATAPRACEPWSVRYAEAAPNRYGISVLGVLALACLVAVLIGTAGLEHVRAQDTTLTAQRTINARPYTWTLPEAGCQLLRGWEDSGAQAWCPSGLYNYDPDGDVTTGKAPGWYPASATR